MPENSPSQNSSSRHPTAVVRTGPRELWPMDSQLKDIQPGSGVVIHLEKAWGRRAAVLAEDVSSRLCRADGRMSQR